MMIKPAYDELYLQSNIELHKLLFLDFFQNVPYKNYNFYELVDLYFSTSEIRAKMDAGNWSALNKGDKQLLNDIDISGLNFDMDKNKNIYIDYFIVKWMAEIYVYLQWKYNIPSTEIIKNIPSLSLAKMYSPLHETSIENACEKLYQKFLV